MGCRQRQPLQLIIHVRKAFFSLPEIFTSSTTLQLTFLAITWHKHPHHTEIWLTIWTWIYFKLRNPYWHIMRLNKNLPQVGCRWRQPFQLILHARKSFFRLTHWTWTSYFATLTAYYLTSHPHLKYRFWLTLWTWIHYETKPKPSTCGLPSTATPPAYPSCSQIFIWTTWFSRTYLPYNASTKRLNLPKLVTSRVQPPNEHS